MILLNTTKGIDQQSIVNHKVLKKSFNGHQHVLKTLIQVKPLKFIKH